MDHAVTTPFEVRWGECDPAGIVYHPVYFDWFAVARMRFLREHGVSYMESLHDRGLVLVVIDVQCQYFKSLRAEDKAWVDASLHMLTKTRLAMQYVVRNERGEVCAQGRTEHAYVDIASQRAVNIAKRAPDVWEVLQKLPRVQVS
ncbi:MAG: acyl-CoA thioesterase [Alicyclobacillus sp.]|nr:acyl-CoA thioesterase [Alicyclobacillus sp.]